MNLRRLVVALGTIALAPLLMEIPARAEVAPAARASTRTVPSPTASSSLPANVDLAYGAYQRGLYVTAFREATARLDRDRSDAPAMTLIGELFNQGLGVKQDTREAAEWYRLAAKQGDAHAMASLGLMAIDGRGVPKDSVAGRDWLEKAAARAEPSAAYNLALILLGTGGEAAIDRAASLLKVAASAEIGDAQHDLGVLYSRGQGVAKSPEEAVRWYARAARNGSIAGEVEYAIALFNGEGVAKSEPIAARYFRRAAIRGNAIAQNRLARLYATGRGVPRNLTEAAAWHLVAAGQGLSDAWLDGALRDLSGQDRTRAEQLAADRAGTL